MNLDYLRYFVRLAEVGHYTKAAEQLCITQPSLSHAIRQLEAELGVPLFERAGRNTTLTRFGAEFLDCARQTLSTLDQGVSSPPRGRASFVWAFCAPWGSSTSPGWQPDSWRPIRESGSALISTQTALGGYWRGCWLGILIWSSPPDRHWIWG